MNLNKNDSMENRIKANELRIGNWIEWDDDSHDIIQVENIVYQEPNYFINGGLLDDMLPIPLSEDWLIRFGFEKINHVHGYSFHSLKRKIGSGLPAISIFDTKTEVNGSWVVNVKYIHQLQNLFFGITQTELNLISKPAQSGENMKG